MATRKVKSYVYENTGEEQEIDGVGLVRKGETITVPYEEIEHKDLKLVDTITSTEEYTPEEAKAEDSEQK